MPLLFIQCIIAISLIALHRQISLLQLNEVDQIEKPKNMENVRKKIFFQNLRRCNVYDLDFVEVPLPVPIKDTMLVAHKYHGGRSKAAGIIFVHYLSCQPTS